MKKIKLSRKAIKSSIDDTNLRKIINDICSEVKKTVDERKYVETFLQDIDFNAVEKGIIDKDFEYASDRLDDVFSYYEQCLEDNEYAERYGDIFTDEVVRLLNKLRKQLSIVMVNSSRKAINQAITFEEKNGKVLAKENNKVIGFIEKTRNGYSYSFGKPSQSNYMSFEVDDLETAKERIKENDINSSYKITQSKERSIMNGAIKELEELFSTKAKGNTVYFNDVNYTPLPLPVQNAVKAIMEEYPDMKYRMGLYSVTVLDKNNPIKSSYRAIKSSSCETMNRCEADSIIWDYIKDCPHIVGKPVEAEFVDGSFGTVTWLDSDGDEIEVCGYEHGKPVHSSRRIQSRNTSDDMDSITSSGAFADSDETDNPECIIEIKKDGKWKPVGIDKNAESGWSTEVKFTVFESEDKARKSGMARRVQNEGYSEKDGTLRFSTK